MKELLLHLQEKLKEDTTVYRGDSSEIDVANFDPEFEIKKNVKQLGQIFAEGPGVYFTDSLETAKQYGNYISEIKLKSSYLIYDSVDGPFGLKTINKILSKLEKEKLQNALSNYDENEVVARGMLIDDILEQDNVQDQLMIIWSSVYYHQNPSDFMRVMSDSGVDGIRVKRNEIYIYVIYNRNILKEAKKYEG